MLAFALSRLLQAIPTLALIIVLIFVLVRLLPGDPASALLGDRATEAAVAKANAEMGTDRPILVQFTGFVERLASGDFGYSFAFRVPVADLILARVPVTLFLAAYSTALAALFAIPLAFFAALRHDKPADVAIRGTFQLGLSMPVFYIGLILLTFLAAQLRWFPVGGYGEGLSGHLYHLFLPGLTLAFSFSAVLMRSLRAAILEAMTAEFIDFARSKGLPRALLLRRHVLRNALVSVVTLFGLHFGSLISGAVVTETVYAIPGVGRLMIEAIFARDYPIVQALTLLFAVLVTVTFIVTDIVHARLDPRIAR